MDYSRAIKLWSNYLRVGAIAEVQQAQLDGLSLADTREEKRCVVTKGSSAIGAISSRLRQLAAEMTAKVLSTPAEELARDNSEQVEAKVQAIFQPDIDKLVKNYKELISNCL